MSKVHLLCYLLIASNVGMTAAECGWLCMGAWGLGTAVGGPYLLAAGLGAAGFTAVGITAGSSAAGMMSTAATTGCGMTGVSAAQSMAAKELSAGIKFAMGAIAAAVARAASDD